MAASPSSSTAPSPSRAGTSSGTKSSGTIMPATWDIPNEYTKHVRVASRPATMMCVMNGPGRSATTSPARPSPIPRTSSSPPSPRAPPGNTGSPVGGHNYVVYALVGQNPDKQAAVLDLLEYINGSRGPGIPGRGTARPSADPQVGLRERGGRGEPDHRGLGRRPGEGHQPGRPPQVGDIYVLSIVSGRPSSIGDKTAEEALAPSRPHGNDLQQLDRRIRESRSRGRLWAAPPLIALVSVGAGGGSP